MTTAEKEFKKDIVKALYANSSFISNKTGNLLDPQTVAREAIVRAETLWELLPSGWKN